MMGMVCTKSNEDFENFHTLYACVWIQQYLNTLEVLQIT